jgi:hypothetical protein
MKNRMKQTILYLTLIALGIGIGYLLNIPIAGIGGGKIVTSPNGKYRAMASTVSNHTLFSAEHRYYQLAIDTSPPDPMIFRMVTIDTPYDNIMQWRPEGNITWDADSSAVTFQQDGISMELLIKLKKVQESFNFKLSQEKDLTMQINSDK